LCDALIQEKDKFLQLGLISNAGTFNKSLVARQKDKSKNTKKQHPHHNNKKNNDPKPSKPTSAPNGDKGAKYKNKKTDKHCKFCGKDGHEESKCFKKMATLEATMKKHNINIDSTTSSFSHRHALCTSGFSFNAISTSCFYEWFIDSRASYHMDKDKAIFSSLNECKPRKNLLVMIDLLVL
jgi:hypothetical protein